MTEQKYARLSVNMNPYTARTVRRIQEEQGITATELVRRAIGVYMELTRNQHEGGKTILADRTGTEYVITLL